MINAMEAFCHRDAIVLALASSSSVIESDESNAGTCEDSAKKMFEGREKGMQGEERKRRRRRKGCIWSMKHTFVPFNVLQENDVRCILFTAVNRFVLIPCKFCFFLQWS